ncbi:hypothetical protein [Streptomyces sp. NPDC052015]|uniref:hypothetical protein n=1 Tax=Streptomyces sp. NPDC052015 TaxID=3154755 RepID=UPI003442AB22
MKGLVAAVKDLASRCPVPIVVESKDERRISSTVESNAYFVVAEAVTNAVKHAQASRIDGAVCRRRNPRAGSPDCAARRPPR